MKWAIVGLVVLGVAAAACAALLVGALRAGSLMSKGGHGEQDGDVQVLYAKEPLESMTVIDGSMVGTKTMPRSKAPKDFIADPVQVVGRILTVPLLKEQAFSGSCFATESNASVAAAVAKGKRAVGISVTDYAGLEGLLYPGCVVDVMVTLRPDTAGVSKTLTSPMTTTLLQRVQVLAIERQTVVSGTADKVGSDVESVGRANSTRRVTLLVDTKQAKTLQFAMQQGTLSLALRNPLDTGEGDKDQVSLRSILGMRPEAEEDASKPKAPSVLERMFNKAMDAAKTSAAKRTATAKVDPFEKPLAPAGWDVTVIRGDNTTKYLFAMPEGVEDKSSAKPTATAVAKPDADDAANEPTPDRPLRSGDKVIPVREKDVIPAGSAR
jgi:pilus assembly protein CpaB